MAYHSREAEPNDRRVASRRKFGIVRFIVPLVASRYRALALRTGVASFDATWADGCRTLTKRCERPPHGRGTG